MPETYFCNHCRQPKPCACEAETYACPPPCPPGKKCEEFTDTDCVRYNYFNPDNINKLSCLGVPNGGSVTAIAERIDEKLCRLGGANYTYLFNTYGVTNFTQFVTAVNQELYDLRTLMNYILGSCCAGSTTAPATSTTTPIQTTLQGSTSTVPATTTVPTCNAPTNLIASLTGQTLSFAFTAAAPVPAVNYAFSLVRINIDQTETVITSGTLSNTYNNVVQTVNLGQTINAQAGISYVFRVVSVCGFANATLQVGVTNNNTTTTANPCLPPQNVSVVTPGATTSTTTGTTTTPGTTSTTTEAPIQLRILWGSSVGDGSASVAKTAGPCAMTTMSASDNSPASAYTPIGCPGTYSFLVTVAVTDDNLQYSVILFQNNGNVFTSVQQGDQTVAISGIVIEPGDTLQVSIDSLL